MKKRTVKNRISHMLLAVMLCAAALFGAARSAHAAESTGSAFYNTEEAYQALKQTAAGQTGAAFDVDPACLMADLGLGYNFGNELDWAQWASGDQKRERSYRIRVSLGYDTVNAGRTAENYICAKEIFVNEAGNIFDRENRPVATQDFASLTLDQLQGAFSGKTDEQKRDLSVGFLKLTVTNTNPEAKKQPLKVNVSTMRLLNAQGNNIAPASVEKEYSNLTLSAASGVAEVFKIQLGNGLTYGDLVSDVNNGPSVRAAIQLEDFVSDFKNDISDFYRATYNGEVANDAEVEYLWKQGIRSIRLPVTWYNHMDASGKVDPEWFAEVNRVVNKLIDRGFYVIVNIHHDASDKGEGRQWIIADQTLFDQYESTYRYLCLQIADNFKDFDEHLILESPNEVTNYKGYRYPGSAPSQDGKTGPISESDYSVMNALNRIFVEEIRSTGANNTNRFLLLNTYFSSRLALPRFTLPADPANPAGTAKSESHLLVGIHDYSTTSSGLLNALDAFVNDSSYGQYLDRYNIVMGEYGIGSGKTETNLPQRLAMMEESVAAAYGELGVPMFVWDDGSSGSGGYGLLGKATNSNGTPYAYANVWDPTYGCDQVAQAMIDTWKQNAEKVLHHNWNDSPNAVTNAAGVSIPGITYTWSEGYTRATATRYCLEDPSHTDAETVNATSETTKQPTQTAPGETTYTAVFANTVFGQTSITVPNIPAGELVIEEGSENVQNGAKGWERWKVATVNGKSYTLYRTPDGTIYHVDRGAEPPVIYDPGRYDQPTQNTNAAGGELTLEDLTPVQAQENVEAAITKIIRTGVKTEMPETTFTFRLEQLENVSGGKDVNAPDYDASKSYDSAGSEIRGFVPASRQPVAIGNGNKAVAAVTEYMANEDAGRPASDNSYKTIALRTDDLFKNVTFPQAGVYAYRVTEYAANAIDTNYKVNAAMDAAWTDSTYTPVNPAAIPAESSRVIRHEDNRTTVITTDKINAKAIDPNDEEPNYNEIVEESLVYSLAEYILYVYVGYKEPLPGATEKETYIYGVGALYTKDDGGLTAGEAGVDPAVGNKADPTPWETSDTDDGSHELSGSELAFTNRYTKKLTSERDPIYLPDPLQKLSFGKTVSGENASESRYFDFQVTIGKTATAEETEYIAFLLDENDRVVNANIDNCDSDMQVTVEYGTAGGYVTAIRFTDFNDAGLVTRRIGLKHGQKIAFTSVPVGTRFEARELFGADYKDWVPTAQVYENSNTAVASLEIEATPENYTTVEDTSRTVRTNDFTGAYAQTGDGRYRVVGDKGKNGANFNNEFVGRINITGLGHHGGLLLMEVLMATAAIGAFGIWMALWSRRWKQPRRVARLREEILSSANESPGKTPVLRTGGRDSPGDSWDTS